MHLSTSFSLFAAAISSVVAAPAAVSEPGLAPYPDHHDHPDNKYVGYLISTESDAVPKVQFHLSNGNNASSFSFLNHGQPVLNSTVGTRGIRDVFLAHDDARTHFYLLATGQACN